MRINHNIAALNTHRQLNSASTAQGKSMEKLSSGLRINRAGDDAAGLAISEKMRAQVRGLDQASKNSQDGISMIQTAEGALNETHDILQRMRELATQAANDTNVGADREEIQKEMNQLTSEINRIGNTTEFNTQKLLDGGKKIDTNATISGKTLTGGSASAATNATATVTAAGTSPVAASWKSGAISTMADDTTGATVTFKGATITLTTASSASAATASNTTTGAVTIANGADQEAYANALKSAFEAVQAQGTGPLDGFTFSVSGSGASAELVITDTTGNGATNNAETITTAAGGTTFDIAGKNTAANAGSNTAGVTGVAASGTVAFANPAVEGSSITLADKKIAFWNSANSTFANANEAKASLGADFIVDVNGDTTGANTSAGVLAAVGASGIAGYTLGDAAGTLTLTANAPGPHGLTTLVGKTDITAVSAAKGSFTFEKAPQEGSSISIGGQKIAFYDSSLENYKNDASAKQGLGADFVVDVKGLNAEQTVDKLLSLQTGLNGKLSNDVNLGKNKNSDGSVNLTITAQNTGFAGNTVKLDQSADSTAGFKASFQIGANTGQSLTIDVADMRSKALLVSGDAASGKVTAKNGTVASYVSTENVSNGTDNKATEFALDVSSHSKASAAVSVINDAIEKVSAERSKLGANQNRLEHTINNLNTSSENLTAAESRIRDVDMAKEMMTQTKNSILSQAAQAMLAQSNQMPQGVLQLLR